MKKKILISILFSNFLIALSQNTSTDGFENQSIISEVTFDNTIHNKFTSKTKNTTSDEPFSSMILKERLAVLDAKTPFDVPYNATVERFIRLYLKEKKRQFLS